MSRYGFRIANLARGSFPVKGIVAANRLVTIYDELRPFLWPAYDPSCARIQMD